MGDREAVKAAIIGMPNRNLLIELPTGHGKTAVALELLRERVPVGGKVLVVVPKTVLKQTFMDEVNKWWPDCHLNFTLSTYRSLGKHIGKWDAAVYDEAHHFTPRCREIAKSVVSATSILLSATVSNKIRQELRLVFDGLGCYRRTVKEAIDNGVLPDPSVNLLPLELDNTIYSETIVKNPKCEQEVFVDWKNRWKYLGKKNIKINIRCTKRQYIIDLDGQIDWFKKQYMRTRNEAIKNRWLSLCSERLRVLSNWKEELVLDILKHLKNYRTLTFCNSIEQTEKLGKHCINSKNKDYQKELDAFNQGRVKHITACNMLDEGVNLANCRIGVYAALNSSERLIKQKLGRLLRHEHPSLVIPYYMGTREEELVQTMLLDYNPDLVSVIKDVNGIVL